MLALPASSTLVHLILPCTGGCSNTDDSIGSKEDGSTSILSVDELVLESADLLLSLSLEA